MRNRLFAALASVQDGLPPARYAELWVAVSDALAVIHELGLLRTQCPLAAWVRLPGPTEPPRPTAALPRTLLPADWRGGYE